MVESVHAVHNLHYERTGFPCQGPSKNVVVNRVVDNNRQVVTPLVIPAQAGIQSPTKGSLFFDETMKTPSDLRF